jgi:glycine cleavage system aminomethyltransferase T
VVQSHLGQIVHETLSQKALHKKRAGGVAKAVGPEFKPQYHKKTKTKTKQTKPNFVMSAGVSAEAGGGVGLARVREEKKGGGVWARGTAVGDVREEGTNLVMN